MDLDSLQAIATDPDIIINKNQEYADLFLEMTKSFFTMTKEFEFKPGAAGQIQSLTTEGMGPWGIWQQIDLQNRALKNSIADVDFNNDIVNEEETSLEFPEEEEHLDEADQSMQHPSHPSTNLEEEFKHISPEDMEAEMDKVTSGLAFGEEEEFPEEEEVNFEDEFGKAANADDNKPIYANDFFGTDSTESHSKPENLDPESAKIRKIEDSLVNPREWYLNGEASASDRPQDSLMDVEVDFDLATSNKCTPPDPTSLQQIIIHRIESMQFDDVIPRQTPKATANQLLELQRTKPKLSLVDLEEKDYLSKAQQPTDELSESAKTGIKKFTEVMREIDRHTNPRGYVSRRPAGHDITISQGAALDMETKPKAKATPEETMAPVGTTRQLKGEAETTHEQRKANIRSRKAEGKKEKEAEEAKKGVSMSQNGKDGMEIQIKKDIEKLAKNQLQGVTVVQNGGVIGQKEKKKGNNKFLL